ncbi:MAG TPA: diaminopimelate decarboxylase [Acidimicrobiales bacterium]|nr:diaminopimelate decarboxylase [Acidimicrobiales bacterium]
MSVAPAPSGGSGEYAARPLPWGLLPDSATIGDDGWLSVGDCSLADLAAEFGTPLFVYDEDHLRARCREAVATFGPGVSYAGKAFLCLAMARLVHEEGMHLDVATGGEMHVALTAGVPPDRLVLHGNNKSDAELARAREVGVGRTVVDSFDELDRLERLHAADGRVPTVLLRATPGVEAHTHEFVQTGQTDSKFGFGVAGGDLAKAVDRAAGSPAVDLVGVHLHIGSQVFVADFFRQAVEVVAPWVRDLALPELSVGGGLGVPYMAGEEAPSLSQWGRVLIDACRAAGITSRITAEPGRAIAAQAAITLYSVGTVKEIPGIRTYVAVDGGMSDNPRPVLYGSGYETFLPREPDAVRPRTVTVVGKHCESGDLLVRDARVPADVAVGDILATPVTGAYGHSMGSNYNKVPRPPVVFARDGDARLVVRRETFDDLVRLDL